MAAIVSAPVSRADSGSQSVELEPSADRFVLSPQQRAHAEASGVSESTQKNLLKLKKLKASGVIRD